MRTEQTPSKPANPSSDLRRLLGEPGSRPWMRRTTFGGLLGVAVTAVALFLIWQSHQNAAMAPRYLTEPLTKGNLIITVTATGTLQPTNKIDVGSELSGTVSRVMVDVNDQVRPGQVLVELDTLKLKDQVTRSQAQWRAAQARWSQVQTTLGDAQQALHRLEQVHRASGGKVPSQAELTTAQTAVARGSAEVASAQALIQDAQAALSVDETNLRKAFIRSPIQGVVLNRSVEPGNAVAASLQAVTLLTLAQDLKQLKLNVNIDEADVGKVREGQRATFTVASYPNRTYPAQVRRVAYGSTIKDNVVTYVAELEVSNEDLSLRPGMTATVVVTTDAREDVWRVPNAALRFAPDVLATEERSGIREGGILSRLVPRMPAQAPRHATLAPGAFQRIWVLREDRPVAIPVDAGPSDGRWTEVRGAGLTADLPVILQTTQGSTPPRP